MDEFTRQFEILKLIRDGELTTMHDLMHVIPDSEFAHYVHSFLEGLRDTGLIELDDDWEITPTAQLTDVLRALRISLKRLAQYGARSIVASPAFGAPSDPPFDVDVFVLMPFANKLKPVYDDHIQTAVSKLDLKAARADDFFTADSIIGDIWNAINASRILIADCTGRNPNVFYELGLAHTLGKPVVLISQTLDDIPFDVQHIRAIIYDYTPRGMKDFETALVETLRTELMYSRTISERLAEFKEKGNDG